MDLHLVGIVQTFRQMFGTIDRTMLPTGTTESHLQVTKFPFYEPLYMMVHQRINGVQERKYLSILLQKIYHRLIKTCELLVSIVLTGIVRRAAVEDVSAAVSRLIDRKTFLEGERIDGDGEVVFRDLVIV